jgi:hypothetical protein
MLFPAVIFLVCSNDAVSTVGIDLAVVPRGGSDHETNFENQSLGRNTFFAGDGGLGLRKQKAGSNNHNNDGDDDDHYAACGWQHDNSRDNKANDRH